MKAATRGGGGPISPLSPNCHPPPLHTQSSAATQPRGSPPQTANRTSDKRDCCLGTSGTTYTHIHKHTHQTSLFPGASTSSKSSVSTKGKWAQSATQLHFNAARPPPPPARPLPCQTLNTIFFWWGSNGACWCAVQHPSHPPPRPTSPNPLTSPGRLVSVPLSPPPHHHPLPGTARKFRQTLGRRLQRNQFIPPRGFKEHAVCGKGGGFRMPAGRFSAQSHTS